MALDREQALAAAELVRLALGEFSRFVDAHERIAAALERIAPEAVPESAPGEAPAAPQCPCPPELRVKRAAVMGEPVIYECGLCHEPFPQPVGA